MVVAYALHKTDHGVVEVDVDLDRVAGVARDGGDTLKPCSGQLKHRPVFGPHLDDGLPRANPGVKVRGWFVKVHVGRVDQLRRRRLGSSLGLCFQLR